MRSKTPLFLIELTIMLLVFAVATALCLNAFSKAELISLENEKRDIAVVKAQNVAEKLKYYGSYEPLGAYHDGEKWVLEDGSLTIHIFECNTASPLCKKADIIVNESGEELFSLTAAYQVEVSP